ncbi:MAG: winged helix-turn-helix domain-containing protein, partial [Paucibacter sp.]|nr:winged helix-turn-helix domain-containing protein [Roseateles sp.]
SGRVARMLVEAAVEEDGRLMLPHKLTQLDIAKRVGASREMVSRILADLLAGAAARHV